MIEILDLWHIYRDGTVAAKDVSFKLYPGEFIGMIGQNGAGKSTILSHIIGLLKPSRGTILVDQQNVSSISVGKIAETVGYVYQNPDLMLFTNQVISELEFAPKNTKVPSYPVLLGIHKNLEIESKLKSKTDKISQYTKIIEALNSKIQKNDDFVNITIGQSKKGKRTISNKSLQAQSIYLSSVLETCKIPFSRKDQAISDIIRESKDIRVLELSGDRILLFSEKKNIVIDEFMTTITKTAIEILNSKLDNIELIERYTDQKTIEELKIIELKKQALDSKEISTILELSEEEIKNRFPEFAAAISGVFLVEIDGVKERVEEGLRIIELEAFSYRHPHALSRGQRHRVAVASVLAMHPKILVLDEPTNGQDYGHTEALMRLVKKISEGGTTVIIISHDMKLIAKYCDRIIVLRKGEILLDGPTNKIFDQNPLLATTNLQSPKVTQVAHLLGHIEDPVLTTEQFIEYYK